MRRMGTFRGAKLRTLSWMDQIQSGSGALMILSMTSRLTLFKLMSSSIRTRDILPLTRPGIAMTPLYQPRTCIPLHSSLIATNHIYPENGRTSNILDVITNNFMKPRLSFTGYGSTTINEDACGSRNTSDIVSICNPISIWPPSPCIQHGDIRWCNASATQSETWVSGTIVHQKALPENDFAELDARRGPITD